MMPRAISVSWLCALFSVCAAAPESPVADEPPARDTLVYGECIGAELPKAKQAGQVIDPMVAADLICRVSARVCYENLRGDPCNKFLRGLQEELLPSGRSLLFSAANVGRADLVSVMIGLGADPNWRAGGSVASPFGEGWTALLIAAANGHAETVSALIQAGGDVNARNKLGRTALMFAASYGLTPIVTDLLVHGADPNLVASDHTGWTALIAAAHKGNPDTVRTLLDHGADLTIRDKAGKTALMWAEAQGHRQVARMLREAGARD